MSHTAHPHGPEAENLVEVAAVTFPPRERVVQFVTLITAELLNWCCVAPTPLHVRTG